jgi:putative ABC transport system ATP-binding protein
MPPLFDFRDVAVTVEGAKVLSGVTVAVPQGQLTVVAGASGSGKTSLLRLCNRLDVPSAGSIHFRGQDLTGIDPRRLRRRVGMVFQRPVLFPGTVRDNLQTAAATASEHNMRRALEDVELEGSFLDRIGDDLSGGEAQRACLARALMCEPEVLLMDEPTASLHASARQTLESTVRRLKVDSGVEVIWVTHDLDQIRRLAENLIVLADGQVQYAGGPDSPEAERSLATLTDTEPT